ncbi:Hypothetical predicted protein, partial [Marmota monax]
TVFGKTRSTQSVRGVQEPVTRGDRCTQIPKAEPDLGTRGSTATTSFATGNK